MKKRTLIASTLTASTLTAGLTLVRQWTYRYLYREHLDESCEEEWYKEEGGYKFKIKNHKNLYLQGYLFECVNATRTIIGLHALGKSASSLKETLPYLRKLFPKSNILLYDAFAHGLSDGYIRGFGYQDILDLMYFQKLVLQKYGEHHRIVMYGQGMGANTILNASGKEQLKNVDMIISDGAYDTLSHYLGAKCQSETNISSKICAPLIRQLIKREVHKDIKKMNTVELIKSNTIPCVFVHSKEDKDVPFSQVFPIYNQAQCIKLLYPIKEGSFKDLIDRQDSYSCSIEEFVNENIK